MKKNILLILITSLHILASCSTKSDSEFSFFVATSGNDSWSGKLAQSNADSTDGPFASLERAREAIRSYKKSATEFDHQIIIYIREGNYQFSKTLELTAEDSGNKNAPIIWRCFPEEKVTFVGAKAIAGFKPISDTGVRDRIDESCRNQILQIDLKGLGITDYGEITGRGGPGMELYCHDRRMTLARYPNEGWLTIADVPQSGEKRFNDGLEREKRYDGVPVGRHYGRIKYDGDRPTRWTHENEIYAHGYWTWDWSDSYQKVKSIDTVHHEITLAEPHHHYGYTKNQRYYFLNILEELDTPGEWMLDRKNGKLYFFLPADFDQNEIFVTTLTEPIISLENCSHIIIQGIDFKFSRSNGIVVNGGSHNLIAGCTFRGLGNDAVVIQGGTENGITSCDIYDVALGGIMLNGGDRKMLLPANNFATNNHIFNWSTWVRTGQLAINLYGVGNRVANNLIHDAPHGAIYLRGNENIVELNEIFNVCHETGDAGAIYTGRNYTWRGNMYRYNYIHHLKGPGLHGVTALYLDDFTSGFTLTGNICYKSGRGTLIGGGRDNVVENNIFIKCMPSIVLDARGLGWASNYFDGTITVLMDSLEAMNYRQPPYSEKYPELLTLYEDDPAAPKNNKIMRNISYGGRWIELYDYFTYDFSAVTIKDNVIADSIVCKRIKADSKGWEPYYLNLDTEEDYLYFTRNDTENLREFKDNLILDSDPGFENMENADFRLKPNSPALKRGFKKIPIEKIGLFVDKYRKELPQKNDVYGSLQSEGK